MEAETAKVKHFLFVDDDAVFLEAAASLFREMSGNHWEITTALNHAQALGYLAKERFDVVVLDVGMPGVDGIQMLRLLGKAHPGLQVVMLSGIATEERRRICLEAGALLFLEKPSSADGYASIFATLDTLAETAADSGFHGVMRQVGLQEILQLECLSKKTSILEVITSKIRARIFISDGCIIHAEAGTLHGEIALYSILALRGGQFRLCPYSEPPERTITGQWEFLLMEAARICDENAHENLESNVGFSQTDGIIAPGMDVTTGMGGQRRKNVQIEEIVLCSGNGELLFDSNCPSIENRMQLMQVLREQVEELTGLAPVGCFDRLEITVPGFRTVCQVNPERRFLVTSRSLGQPELTS